MKFLKKVSNKLVGNIREQAKLVTFAKVIEKLNEVISELEKLLEEKQNYSNYKYWQKFPLSFFDSETDRENIKEIRECIKNGTINQEHLDYVAGDGRYKGQGLLDYIKQCKREKITQIIDKMNMGEEEIVEKGKELEETMQKNKQNIPVPKGATEKFEKEVKKIIKEV